MTTRAPTVLKVYSITFHNSWQNDHDQWHSGTRSEKKTGLCGKNSQQDCGGYIRRLRRLYGFNCQLKPCNLRNFVGNFSHIIRFFSWSRPSACHRRDISPKRLTFRTQKLCGVGHQGEKRIPYGGVELCPWFILSEWLSLRYFKEGTDYSTRHCPWRPHRPQLPTTMTVH